MNNEIAYDPKFEQFNNYLAQFISFVEEESKRIDEEKKGAHRRDGGRGMTCAIFLKELLEYVVNNEDEAIIEWLKNKKVPAFPVESEELLKLHEGAVLGYQACTNDIVGYIKNK